MCIAKMQTIILLLAFILMASLVPADATQKISYQGYLTDSLGAPVADNYYQIRFTIYNAGGVSQWSSGEQSIHVSNGQLNYNLGSVVPLADSIFLISELYLGIKVGEDSEISPKTLLTSAPGAAVARSLSGGSIETRNGSFVLKNVNGDSALVFIGGADYHLLRIHPPEPGYPPDPVVPGIELYVNDENRIDLYYPGGDSDEGIVQIGANSSQGGYIAVHASEPLTATRVLIGGSATDTGFIALFGGDNGSEYKLLEMNSQTGNGASLSFFDPENIDGRKLLTMNAAPGAGGNMVMFNPQPEPPGQVALELGMNTFEKGTNGGRISVFDVASLETKITGGQFKIYHHENLSLPNGSLQVDSELVSLDLTGEAPPLGGEPPVISMKVDDSAVFYLQGESGAAPAPKITMITNSTEAKVGIGTDSIPEALTVMGNGWFSGDVYSYTLTKAKKNIQPIDNALERITRMNGYYYDCRTDEFPSLRMPKTRQVGFLAEEVKEVVPEIVGENKYGLTGVAYSRISALLVEAVKELKIENELLKMRIEKLEAKNN